MRRPSTRYSCTTRSAAGWTRASSMPATAVCKRPAAGSEGGRGGLGAQPARGCHRALCRWPPTCSRKGRPKAEDLQWRKLPVAERLQHALLKGITQFIEEDAEAARLAYDAPIKVMEGPLMDGMSTGATSLVKENVPAPGRQVRPCHETGRCLPATLHRVGKSRRQSQ